MTFTYVDDRPFVFLVERIDYRRVNSQLPPEIVTFIKTPSEFRKTSNPSEIVKRLSITPSVNFLHPTC